MTLAPPLTHPTPGSSAYCRSPGGCVGETPWEDDATMMQHAKLPGASYVSRAAAMDAATSFYYGEAPVPAYSWAGMSPLAAAFGLLADASGDDD